MAQFYADKAAIERQPELVAAVEAQQVQQAIQLIRRADPMDLEDLEGLIAERRKELKI